MELDGVQPLVSESSKLILILRLTIQEMININFLLSI